MEKLLSIHIPTIVGRELEYNNLYNLLLSQIKGNEDIIEIITLKDNKEISIGQKRQRLVEMSKGVYSVQVDDDDLLVPDYIPTILKALKSEPDFVGYLEEINVVGRDLKKIACHSNRYIDWGDNLHGYDYVRTPFFKDVIRTDIMKVIGCKDIRFGEDHDFSRRLKQSKLIKTEVFIDKIMYLYSQNILSPEQHKKRYGIL